jgi:GNAT superfamily N-acetyltransferase
MLQPWMIPADLAPGDAKCATRDWTGFELHRVRELDSPEFAMAYGALWEEFGAKHEMESADVLARRVRWSPGALVNGCALLYELLLVTKGGAFVGVRDHTAIVDPEHAVAVVHLSHNLVAPAWRGGGIAGWLRALPISAARLALTAQGLPETASIFLVAEMEPADPSDEARTIRLAAYEKAGYRKLAGVPYLQPDFRAPKEIDASGGPRPLPLSLLVREVGNDSCAALPAETVRHIAGCLYRMYGAEFRESDMARVWENLDRFPSAGTIPLVPPTEP